MYVSTNDYYVSASGVIERGTFYNYLINLGYKAYGYNREDMINSSYPFAIRIKKKRFTVIESATLCFFNQKAGRVKSVQEFINILESNR